MNRVLCPECDPTAHINYIAPFVYPEGVHVEDPSARRCSECQRYFTEGGAGGGGALIPATTESSVQHIDPPSLPTPSRPCASILILKRGTPLSDELAAAISYIDSRSEQFPIYLLGYRIQRGRPDDGVPARFRYDDSSFADDISSIESFSKLRYNGSTMLIIGFSVQNDRRRLDFGKPHATIDLSGIEIREGSQSVHAIIEEVIRAGNSLDTPAEIAGQVAIKTGWRTLIAEVVSKVPMFNRLVQQQLCFRMH